MTLGRFSVFSLEEVNFMKNKQHEYILKAFLESKIPAIMRRNAPELMSIDSIIGGYCTQLIKRVKFIEIPSGEIISNAQKNTFSELIDRATGMEKDELVVYYRLARLVESILIQYRQRKTGDGPNVIKLAPVKKKIL